MTRYASNTTVPIDRSKAEIERNLARFGASEFGYWAGLDNAAVGFIYRGVRIEMSLPYPTVEAFRHTPAGRERTDIQTKTEHEKEVKRRWRSLAAVIKALLVGVDDGVLTFEDAFMPWIVWGNGLTTRQLLLPELQKAIESGKMPRTLKPEAMKLLESK